MFEIKICTLVHTMGQQMFNPGPKPTFIKNLKELRLSQFLHYCS